MGWVRPVPFRRSALYHLEHPGPCWICFLQTKAQGIQTQISQKKLLDNNNICLLEIHGKDEFHQAIQVLAPRFRLFGSFLRDNENAGGSAICIHRDLLEEAIVTHVVSCQGRDHLLNIRSGRHSLVIVNVRFEPQLTLNQLRGRLCIIHPHWPAYPCGVGVILGDFNICDPEEGSPMATRERLLCSILSFPTSLRLLNLITRGGTPQPLGSYALFQGLILFLNKIPLAEVRDFHCFSHVFENLGNRTIRSDHAAVRLVIQKPTHRGHQSKRIETRGTVNDAVKAASRP